MTSRTFFIGGLLTLRTNYSLCVDCEFLAVTSTISNVGSTAVSNVRLWTGNVVYSSGGGLGSGYWRRGAVVGSSFVPMNLSTSESA